MPRRKGSKKKDRTTTTTTSSSRTSICSFLLSSNDDINWFSRTSIDNKISRTKKIEFNQSNDETIISSNDLSTGRVVVNPAVLKYLEQNRSINQLEPHYHHQQQQQQHQQTCNEYEQLISDNILWDFRTYSTEFLTSIQLAQWILMKQCEREKEI